MNWIFIQKEILPNGSIVLEKKYYDTEKFELVESNGNTLLVPKIKIYNILTLTDLNSNIKIFTHSKILSCLINELRPTDNKFRSILKDIYLLIGKGKLITKNTILNFETLEKTDNGFYYLEKIGISIQSAEAGQTFKEIVNQCIQNKIKLSIDILFKSGETNKFII